MLFFYSYAAPSQHGTIESLRSEKMSKIPKSNPSPSCLLIMSPSATSPWFLNTSTDGDSSLSFSYLYVFFLTTPNILVPHILMFWNIFKQEGPVVLPLICCLSWEWCNTHMGGGRGSALLAGANCSLGWQHCQGMQETWWGWEVEHCLLPYSALSSWPSLSHSVM